MEKMKKNLEYYFNNICLFENLNILMLSIYIIYKQNIVCFDFG